MKKKSNGGSALAHDDIEIPQTAPEFFKTAVMGKYARQATHGKTVRTVRLEADVARSFANAKEVNQALRLVEKMRQLGRSGQRKKTA